MTKLIPFGNGITLVDTGKKPSREEILKQLKENALKYEPYSDEIGFERYLIRKWCKEKEL